MTIIAESPQFPALSGMSTGFYAEWLCSVMVLNVKCFQPFQGCPPVSTINFSTILWNCECLFPALSGMSTGFYGKALALLCSLRSIVSSPFRDVHRFLPKSWNSKWKAKTNLLGFQPFQGCPPVSTQINISLAMSRQRSCFQPFQGCPPVSTRM